MPSTDIIHWRRGFMGPPLPARHVSGGRLLQSGLLSVPQHIWGANTSIQCQRAGGEKFVAFTSVHSHPRTDWEPRRPARPGVFHGLHQHFRGEGPSGRSGRPAAEQAAEDELVGEGGPAEEGAFAQLPACREGVQHRGPPHEAAEAELLPQPRSTKSAAAQVTQGGLWAHDTVDRRPVPAQPTNHAVTHSCAHAQPPSVSWREAGGQSATKATKNECWPLKSEQQPPNTRRYFIQETTKAIIMGQEGLVGSLWGFFLWEQAITGNTVISVLHNEGID